MPLQIYLPLFSAFQWIVLPDSALLLDCANGNVQQEIWVRKSSGKKTETNSKCTVYIIVNVIQDFICIYSMYIINMDIVKVISSYLLEKDIKIRKVIQLIISITLIIYKHNSYNLK